ncbi:transposase [Paraburkholderia panacisoli]|uniref:transposase n=1 Tax=Paraburkholderia panacisoli TaxID=2603818 RepID=UPI001FE8C4AC|nr:transposase [Paraburkholderia panacisoli]
MGAGSAWTLVRERFGWRQFRNRRELAGCLGLTPTPYASGTSEVELGISKAGNRRCRWLMAELAWSWLSPAASSAIDSTNALPARARGCGASVSSRSHGVWRSSWF